MILFSHMGQSRLGTVVCSSNVSYGSVIYRYQTDNFIIDYGQKNLDRKLVSITPHVSHSDLHKNQYHLGSSCDTFASPQYGQSYYSTSWCVFTTSYMRQFLVAYLCNVYGGQTLFRSQIVHVYDARMASFSFSYQLLLVILGRAKLVCII